MKVYSVKGILSLFLAATSEALKTIKPNIWKWWSIKKSMEEWICEHPFPVLLECILDIAHNICPKDKEVLGTKVLISRQEGRQW